MKFIADLHLHSKYSRATAKNLDLENLYHAAQLKGVTVVGTGDFTHPAWIEEIESKLEQAEPGLYSLKKEIAQEIDKIVPQSCRGEVRFILQSEISSIYKKNDRVRKNHNLVYFPDLKSVKKFNAALDAIGNIKSDGRPILGLDAKKLLELMLDINDQGMFVPAHIWTPWFSLFGSKSGFDDMTECFEELTQHIFAVETGLSSDPPMNWRIKQLDNLRLISSSDAHSPGFLGRNASVFNTNLSFSHIRNALKDNDLDAYKGTLDMYPHQGKYHYDGHRKCDICLNPAMTLQMDGICPVCGKPLTCGVLYRVQELATRPEGFVPKNRQGFKSIIPLTDILSEIFEVGPKTKKVTTFYNKALDALGPELNILLDLSYERIESANVPLLADAVMKMRAGDIKIDPGFDGEYGVVNIFDDEEKDRLRGEKDLLFNLPKKKKKKRAQRARKIGPDSFGQDFKKKNKPGSAVKSQKEDDLLKGLNLEQQKAVESKSRAIVVQAGPGTGKTRVLTAKIAWLVSQQKVAPQKILALTFTNKAAKELEKRIETYLPASHDKISNPKASVMSATFHSFCLHLLRTYKTDFSATILDDNARAALIRQALGSDTKMRDVKKADLYISRCKQNLLAPSDPLPDDMQKEADAGMITAYENYWQLCAKENVIDFEDLILMTVTMLKNDDQIYASVLKRYPYLFIDEYQDLNFGQYVLTKLLADGNHILVIGDPDQSIYGFRGSDNRYFKLFETDFPGCEKIFLTRNYRSTQTILDASFQMIRKSKQGRGQSKVFSDITGATQLVIKQTSTEQAEAVAIGKMIENLVGGTSFFSMDSGKAGMASQKEYSFADFAILYRTSKQCDTFVSMLEKEGIPFQTADKKRVFDIEGIKQLISLCRMKSGCQTFHDIRIVFDLFGVTLKNKALKEVKQLFNDHGRWFAKDNGAPVFNEDSSLTPAMRKKIEDASFKINACMARAETDTVIKQIEFVCEKAGLKEKIDAHDAGKRAWENIIARAPIYEDLRQFLDGLALDRDTDVLGLAAEKVSLMTMHAAKGLEFPVVFVSGCEMGLIPFARDGKTIEDMEEERRLFYVGMTRAMDILCLTYAQKRRIYGTQMERQRSFFIDDIEKKLMQVQKSMKQAKAKKKERQLELF